MISRANTVNNLSAQAHILFVEDDVSAMNISEFILRQAGHAVTRAFNGKEGLILLNRSARSSKPVNLVITDLAMPVMSGIDFIPEIRKRGFSMPVVVTTGCLEKYSEPDLKNMGADLLLFKPFDAANLTDCVKTILARTPLDASFRFRRSLTTQPRITGC